MMKKRILPLWLGRILVVLALLAACNGDGQRRMLPNATGREYELVVVTDSLLHDDDPLKRNLRRVFGRPFPGLPQSEPWFRLNFIQADNLNNYFKRHKSMMMVDTGGASGAISDLMEQLFGSTRMEMARTDTTLFFSSARDVWAQPQRVAFLFAPGRNRLIEQLRQRDSSIVYNFHGNELRHLKRIIYRTEEQKSVEQQMQRRLGYSVRVPINYRLDNYFDVESAKARFVRQLQALGLQAYARLRSETRETSNNILFYTQPYRSQKQLSQDSILRLRSLVGKAFVPLDAEGSYMVTERKDFRPETHTTTFKGRYTRVTRGLWEAEGDFMGGPFLHYAILDEARQRIIHIDGFVYAAGVNKKPFMTRMEVILNTFGLADTARASLQ